MRFSVISLFPEWFEATLLKEGVLSRGIRMGALSVEVFSLRDFSDRKDRRVDDSPYGGGPGMILRCEPLFRALAHVREKRGPGEVVYLSPRGVPFSHALAQEQAQRSEAHLILICGRYEGVDERFLTLEVQGHWSLGDFVLSGGELAAMCMMDAIGRLLPGVLGNEESLREESFAQGLLEHPQYTRPEVFQNQAVPSVLLSGNHKEIQAFRHSEALRITREFRPDLMGPDNA